MGSPITLGSEIGLAFYLAVGITYAVQGVKYLLEWLPTTKTNNLPSWLWVPVSLAVAVAVCWVMKQDGLNSVIKLDLSPPLSYIATGLGIGFSSNVIFAVTKPLRKKLKKDGKIVTLAPGVALPIPEPQVFPEPETVSKKETPNLPPTDRKDVPVDSSTLNLVDNLVEPKPYVPKHAAPEQDRLFSLTLVEPKEPVWIGKDSDPTHVLVPKGWPSE